MTDNRTHDVRDQDDGPSFGTTLLRGLLKRCPRCGHGALYAKYLKPKDRCETCQAEIGVIRADDMPAYLTIVVVGHIVVPLALVVEKLYAPSVSVHMALWLPMIVVMTLAMLPGIKGATIGLMWRLGLRGDERQ